MRLSRPCTFPPAQHGTTSARPANENRYANFKINSICHVFCHSNPFVNAKNANGMRKRARFVAPIKPELERILFCNQTVCNGTHTHTHPRTPKKTFNEMVWQLFKSQHAHVPATANFNAFSAIECFIFILIVRVLFRRRTNSSTAQQKEKKIALLAHDPPPPLSAKDGTKKENGTERMERCGCHWEKITISIARLVHINCSMRAWFWAWNSGTSVHKREKI